LPESTSGSSSSTTSGTGETGFTAKSAAATEPALAETVLALNWFDTAVFFVKAVSVASAVFDASTDVAIIPMSNNATTAIDIAIFFLIFHDHPATWAGGNFRKSMETSEKAISKQ
jgi:hypothetical protein